MVEQRRADMDVVKVLDFGIAKIQDSTGDEGPALTRAGFVCGTPEYMSPEQARGSTLDARSDLYAVGVILYQLTSGLLPFEADSAVGFATKHLTETPLPPSRRRPDAKISPAMERLILRTLSKDPNDRPQTAEQFRAELLAVEKERRQQAKRGAMSPSPTLQPLPRKATPHDGAVTEVQDSPNWSKAGELTVRAYANQVDLPPGATAPGQEKTVQAPNLMPFKIITVALVVVAVGLAAVYLYTASTGVQEPVPVKREAPVALQPTSGDPNVQDPPYERIIAADRQDREGSARLARSGDLAHQNGDLDTAASAYTEAFLKAPSSELSLKLGEVHYQLNQTDKAKGWWKRHLRDQADSRAKPYIQNAFQDL